MNILLVCAGGASTSIIVDRMKSALNESQSDWHIEALGVSDAKNVIGKFDCVMIAPQIRYQKKVIEEIAKPLGVKVLDISPKDYGNFNGAKIIALATQ